VEHFWERCPISKAFSARAKMAKAFKDYTSFLPHAAADTVRASIDGLIESVSKRPKDLLELGKMAEATFYADSAEYWSDELYLPFARAVAGNKKIKEADRSRFAAHVKILENSSEGSPLPQLNLRLADGSSVELDSLLSRGETIIMFDDPDNTAASLGRIRLAANIAARQLSDAHVVKFVIVNPGEASGEWFDSMKSLPSRWVAGAMPEAGEYFDMRIRPAIYRINNKGVITNKYLTVDGLISRYEEIVAMYR